MLIFIFYRNKNIKLNYFFLYENDFYDDDYDLDYDILYDKFYVQDNISYFPFFIKLL